MNILIVDDHAVVRRGVKEILCDEYPKANYWEAKNLNEAIHILQNYHLDIVILDITLPGRSGLDLLKDCKKHNPKIPVLVYSIHPEDQFAVRTIKAGASGYMVKESIPEELIYAVKKILSGGKYISNSLAEKLADTITYEDKEPKHESLSDREFQVMCLIASGKKPNEIADKLSLSIKTISTYRHRVLEKMKMNSNAELTYYAIKNKLVE